ncbi:MAG: M14 family zinc carboxypeptidase [Candidatus Saccharibacteria bacterium]|nr:M14 family zinc carboxypeptidase [Candidatus Saccharibacteria bacterium]
MTFNTFNNKYLPPQEIDQSFEYFKNLNAKYCPEQKVIGKSVNDLPIHMYSLGRGQISVLLYSQIHGHEPTSTRGLLIFLNQLLASDSGLLDYLKLSIIPQVNPDGALAYTRANANNLDLNHDAKNLSQPESQALAEILKNDKPDYCFSLHDHRTFHAAGEHGQPSSLAFLAPAFDQQLSMNKTRRIVMQIVGIIKEGLTFNQPVHLAVFNETYVAGGFGELAISLNIPSVLMEAGFFNRDYLRHKPAQLIAQSLSLALQSIADQSFEKQSIEIYQKLPRVKPEYVDFLIKGASFEGDNQLQNIKDITLFFKEELIDGQVILYPNVILREDWPNIRGYYNLDLNQPIT